MKNLIGICVAIFAASKFALNNIQYWERWRQQMNAWETQGTLRIITGTASVTIQSPTESTEPDRWNPSNNNVNSN